MDCVNHSGVTATAFCQNCGKALCNECVRKAPGGQILCAPCLAQWQSVPPVYTPGFSAGPNPATAAVLGLIPGVGAMYNGQFLKGLAHLFIFAVLVSASSHFGIFGLFIAGWIFYQSFEAYHVAKARRDGMPLPDPLGLNEISNWFNPGARGQHPGQPGSVPPGFGTPVNPGDPAGAAQAAPGQQQPFESPYKDRGPWQNPYQGPAATGSDPAGQGYAGQNYPGQGVPPPIPPIPPMPPTYFWRRKEPIGAIILIALGIMLLLGQLDLLSGRVFELGWPLMIIALGIFLIVRRLQDTPGGRK